MKETVQEIPLQDVYLDRETQIRAAVSEETIQRYFDIMVDEEGRDKFPPITLFQDDKGVVARAFYSVSQDVLETFCSQLVDGGDHPCRAAIDAFVSCLESWDNRRESTKREIYRRCELTLEAFTSNTAYVSFGKNISELFPLPGEFR